jgi:hypothetical protein
MPFLKNLSAIARKKKSHENPATQEGNIQAVSIIFMGSIQSFASNASSGSLPIQRSLPVRDRGVVNVVHIHPLPQTDRT